MKILYTAILLTAFSAQAQNMDSYVNSLTKLRSDVEANIDQTPYQKMQQETFKSYFVELGALIDDLDNSSKFLKKYQSHFKSQGVKSVCQTIFLDKVRWKELVKKCTKNRFFLCAEEVRAFGTYKEALKDRLPNDLIEEFNKEPYCEI